MTTHDERRYQYNTHGDVYNHTYAYPPAVLETAERSSECHTISDELWWAAKVNEAGDRKLADLLRRAQARIAALEDLCVSLRTRANETLLDGKTE